MKAGCIVLAAGQSKRFGQENKLTGELQGKPLAQWILETIPRDAFSAICAVVSSDEVKELCVENGFPFVQYGGGMLSDSIRCGLKALPEDLDGYFFVNADRPFLQAITIRRMLAQFQKTPEAVTRLYWQDTPSNPILFPKVARAALLSLEGDRGGSFILKSGKYPIEPVYAGDESETWDADSPEALQAMRDFLLQRRQNFVYD